MESDLYKKYKAAHSSINHEKTEALNAFLRADEETKLAIYFLKSNLELYKIKYTLVNSSYRNKKICENILFYFPNANKQKITSFLNGKGIYNMMAFIIRLMLLGLFINGLIIYFTSQIDNISDKVAASTALSMIMISIGLTLLCVWYENSNYLRFYFINVKKLKSE